MAVAKRARVLRRRAGAAAKTIVGLFAIARNRALSTTFAGGVVFAVGAALVYPPAGVLVGGLELAAFGLVLMDDGRKPPSA